MSLLIEVRDFLRDLRRDLPDIFAQSKAPPAAKLPAGERGRALEVLSERARHWSGLIGVEFRGIRVKDQRTLWGSCSSQGNLNFNWRLIHAPPPVLDYVVIHELVHLLEMNHSRRFWAQVSRWCPEHKAHRRWLREAGRELMGRPLN